MGCRLTPDQIRLLLPLAKLDELTAEQASEMEGVVGSAVKSLEKTFAKLHDQSFPGWRRVAYLSVAKGVASAWQLVCERLEG